MRLRIFDLNTPWFWLTIFYQKTYGKPWISAELWSPHAWKRWWIYAWTWERVPDERGAYAMAGQTETKET